MSVNPIGTAQTGATQQAKHGHGHHGARKAGMDGAAEALGMSSSDLQSALKSGQSLSSLAQAKGVSADKLSSAISDAIGKANPTISGDRAKQIADRMVNGPTGDKETGTVPS